MALLYSGAQDPALTSTHWSFVHGLAGLIIDGPMAEQLPTLAARHGHWRTTLKPFADLALRPDQP